MWRRGLLPDPELLMPLVERWQAEFEQTGRAVLSERRATVPLETFVRVMVLKQRCRWGYRTVMADAGLALSGVKTLAREGREPAGVIGEKKARVRDPSRSTGGKLRSISRTIRRRSAEAH
jgi:hypothetical protein